MASDLWRTWPLGGDNLLARIESGGTSDGTILSVIPLTDIDEELLTTSAPDSVILLSRYETGSVCHTQRDNWI